MFEMLKALSAIDLPALSTRRRQPQRTWSRRRHYMKILSLAGMSLFAALLLAIEISTTAAGEGVGTATLELENKATGRKITTELWFEAAGDAKIEWFTPRLPLRPIPIARNANPKPPFRKHPLIVISHGNWGTRFSQGWLAVELVKSGYVVLSTSHPGTVGDDQTVSGRLRLWDRSHDVSFALDEVLRDPRWAALIDENRIGFVGHSFGGWTGVSLAGGRYDPARQRAFCDNARKKDFYCDATLKDDVAGVPAKDAGDSFEDGRIKAFYIIGAGPGQGFAPDSLKLISVPFVVDTAQFDEILDPVSNSTNLARQIPSAREVVRPVGHFAYVPECRWLVGPILTKLAGLPLCDDPQGVDRAQVHKQVAPDVVAFFKKNLAGAE
jgi:predicted dienelactone hydrolase